jgi:ATP synthase I chain
LTDVVLDDHRALAARTTRLMLLMAAVLAIALVAARRADAVGGLAAGTAVGIADVLLLSRSLTRFGGGAGLNPRALGAGMFTRFLSVGVLLGLVLCIRALNPLAALVGFLLMPASIAVTGTRLTRRSRAQEALDAGR